jgi:endonuclease III-like uncharacterized protein
MLRINMFISDEFNSNQEIFDEKTFRRLQVIEKIKPPFIDTILNYVQKLPICNFVNYTYSILENLKYEEDIEEIPSPQIHFYFLPSIWKQDKL